MTGNVLMIMIEPTPYILSFIRQIKSVCPGEVDVLFVERDVSQQWVECVVEHRVLPLGFLMAARVLWAHLNSSRYSLVHIAGWSHPVILMALLICAMRGIPTAVESDTPLREEPAGWRRWLKRLGYPLLFRLPRIFLPGGSRQAAYFRDYGVPPERIRIAQMTVDVETMRAYHATVTREQRAHIRNRMGITAGQVAFLFVGRLEARKGIRDLLVAYASLRERSAVDCVLVIVGHGDCGRDVDEVAGRVAGIVATGRLVGTDLLNAYAAADVFVLPSRWEPWGLVVNEAMAFGLPVIATDAVGCIDDLVAAGVTGLIVPAGDSASLAEGMATLADDARLRYAFGAAGNSRIQSWSLRNEAGRVVSAWQEAQVK
jgi:glycosyltransferase involved in cell wall biosynthesis